MTSRTVARFKQNSLPRQAGEFGRLRVVQGPDAGTIFVMKGTPVFIGRGEDNDVILTDLKTSRKHLRVDLEMGQVILRDAGSTHGFQVNGASLQQTPLRNGNQIEIGATILEFQGADAGAAELTAAPKLRPPSRAPSGNVIAGLEEKQKTFIEKNKNFLLIVATLTVFAMLLPEVEKKQRAKRTTYLDPKDLEAEQALSRFALPPTDKTIERNADNFFKEGFREYRAGNYLRAQAAFDTALQIWADHPLARLYAASTKKAMEDEAKKHLALAKQDEDANRTREARDHFDAVKRLYYREPANILYKEAATRMEELSQKGSAGATGSPQTAGGAPNGQTASP